MTVPSEVDVVVAPAPAETDRSYVDWPAIIAGIVIASAISILLLTFGSAIGLSFTNFRAGEDVAPIWIAIAAATWLLWVQISSFMAGGYITGRLRKRHGDATEEESDLRDGAHGLLVWGGALIVGAIIAVGGVGAAATAIGNTAGALTNAASNVAGDAAEDMNPNAYFTDILFRPAPPATETEEAAPVEAPAAPAADPATPATGTTTPAAPAATPAPAPTVAADTAEPATDPAALRSEAGRIYAQAALDGELAADDRAYLVQAVAANTGLSEEEAAARVDQVSDRIAAAADEAAAAAEEARKATVLGAFLTAAALLVSAVGAYWAAQKGGNHRDRNMAFPEIFRRW